MADYSQPFLQLAIDCKVLCFGEFRTKAGRLSPYFFNAGLFNDGASLAAFCRFYAQAILDSGVEFDMIFGPAYKGIPLAAGTAIALNALGRNVPFAFNRKEAKDHGEGGMIVGAPLTGRVLIIDDVISAGTSVRESVQIIEEHDARAAAVAIALDRQEKGQGELSAIEEVELEYEIPVVAISTLDDLFRYMQNRSELHPWLAAVADYRQQYGVAGR